jgi:hypothetical protein
MPKREQDVQTLLRALVNLKAAASSESEKDSVLAAAALEEVVAAAEKRRSICARTAQAREWVGL